MNKDSKWNDISDNFDVRLDKSQSFLGTNLLMFPDKSQFAHEIYITWILPLQLIQYDLLIVTADN